jgi:hypothetical protein
MYKVDVPYTDYFDNDTQRVETMYFNINAFELAEIAVEYPEGLGEYVRRVTSSRDNQAAFAVMKTLFVRGYGRRQEVDGRWRFVKNPNWLTEILPSPEFEAFYLMLSDTPFAVKFWNGLISEELLKRAQLIQENGEILPPESKPDTKKFRDMTLEEQVAALREKAAAGGVVLDAE